MTFIGRVLAPLLNWSCSVLHVFLTDVCDCYVLVADGFHLLFFFFFVYIVSHQCCYSNFSFSIHLLSFVPYTWNDLSHRRPALMALTFPAAYLNRNVIFFSLVYVALLWLIVFHLSSSSAVVTIATRLHFDRCALAGADPELVSRGGAHVKRPSPPPFLPPSLLPFPSLPSLPYPSPPSFPSFPLLPSPSLPSLEEGVRGSSPGKF